MDPSAQSAQVFNQWAEHYQSKYMDLDLYDESYALLARTLPPHARVLDAACGPGTVARRLLGWRPDLQLLGVDLAPRMVELARTAVPGARFEVGDCRQLPGEAASWDAIVCAFGLPYLGRADAQAFINQAAQRLAAGGLLYLSTQGGRLEDSGPQRSSRGDVVQVFFHAMEGPGSVGAWLTEAGLQRQSQALLPCPANASVQTADWYCIARKP
ncbi:class I SAM-dependent methyltransferase [Mitsuaria sp. WAJ17]|uniref:class I SAM-dependent DNA methyltransferase n=1 Tax=Mitsuaria sp. WAJ17 TaxID=2761452 RepID=UPI001602D299|nr:class I SAM-dependent methyltransferase [Mitsuaria sp. WAJ17]MBB2483675.1 class I SAM-dependent methyltransferase [Mitsuaria sp. WAJ17]